MSASAPSQNGKDHLALLDETHEFPAKKWVPIGGLVLLIVLLGGMFTAPLGIALFIMLLPSRYEFMATSFAIHRVHGDKFKVHYSSIEDVEVGTSGFGTDFGAIRAKRPYAASGPCVVVTYTTRRDEVKRAFLKFATGTAEENAAFVTNIVEAYRYREAQDEQERAERDADYQAEEARLRDVFRHHYLLPFNHTTDVTVSTHGPSPAAGTWRYTPAADGDSTTGVLECVEGEAAGARVEFDGVCARTVALGGALRVGYTLKLGLHGVTVSTDEGAWSGEVRVAVSSALCREEHRADAKWKPHLDTDWQAPMVLAQMDDTHKFDVLGVTAVVSETCEEAVAGQGSATCAEAVPPPMLLWPLLAASVADAFDEAKRERLERERAEQIRRANIAFWTEKYEATNINRGTYSTVSCDFCHVTNGGRVCYQCGKSWCSSCNSREGSPYPTTHNTVNKCPYCGVLNYNRIPPHWEKTKPDRKLDRRELEQFGYPEDYEQ